MAETRQALLAAVGRATQAYQRATDGFDDTVGRVLSLNPTDLRCLDWLSEGDMTAGQLADAVGLSSAATTTLLDRLEAKGFVRRVRDTADRRRVLVGLTDAGGQQIGRLYGPLAQEGGRMLRRFSTAELTRIRAFLDESTALVDRERARLRAAGSRRGA